MAKPYRLSPLAECDLEDIWLFTQKNWSTKQADTYHNSLVASFHELATGKKQGSPVNVLPYFQKYLCGSHVVYFLDDNDHLDIIRILHQRQDVEGHL